MRLSILGAALLFAVPAVPALADTFNLGTIGPNSLVSTTKTWFGGSAATDTFNFELGTVSSFSLVRSDTGISNFTGSLLTSGGTNVYTFSTLQDGETASSQVSGLTAGASYKLVLSGTPTGGFYGFGPLGSYDLTLASGSSVAAVPELPGWAIAIGGLGFIGLARARPFAKLRKSVGLRGTQAAKA